MVEDMQGGRVNLSFAPGLRGIGKQAKVCRCFVIVKAPHLLNEQVS